MKRITAVLISAFTVIFILFGCSSGGANASFKTGAAAADAAATAGQAGTGAVKMSASASEKTTAAASSANRKIEKSAGVVIETVNYEKSTARFEPLVGSYGGYIESSSIEGKASGGADRLRIATYTARIPAEKLDGFLNASSDIGNVASKSVSGRDVTQAYVDTNAQLTSLQAERDRLLDFMDKASSMDNLLKIEERLTQVQGQIEQLTAELKNMDSLISYSTVTVTIREVTAVTKPAEKSLWGQIGSTFSASVSALGQVLKDLAITVTAVLPFAAVAGAVVGIVIFVHRKIKPRKKPDSENTDEKPGDSSGGTA